MREKTKKLTEQKAKLIKEMEDLVNVATEEERALTEEEQAKFDEMEKKINALTETVAAIEKQRELKKEAEDEEGTDTDGTSTSTPSTQNDEAKTKEERAYLNDAKVFAQYVRNVIEERADSNLTMGNNGAIIPTTIANKIIQTAYDISPVLQKATKYNTKGQLEIPTVGVDNNTINMAYAEEFKDLEGKSKNFSSVSLNNFLAGALTKISNSLINNTDIDLTEKVIEIMSVDVARFLEKEALIDTSGKEKGCSTAKLNVTATAQTAITADELIDLKNKSKQVFRKNSIWIMGNDTKTAIEKLKDADGRYLFNNDLTGEFDGNIMGYPVYVSDNMPAMSAGSVPILFGDFSGLAVKQTKDLEMQILRELYATQHATGIVAWTEFDMKIENYQKIAKLTMATASGTGGQGDS